MGHWQKRQQAALKKRQYQKEKEKQKKEWVPPNPPTNPPNIHGRPIEYDLPQDTLPEGWERSVLVGGRVLYVNPVEELSQFEHPSEHVAEGSDVGSGGF